MKKSEAGKNPDENRKTCVGQRELLIFIFVQSVAGQIRYRLRMIAGSVFGKNFDVANMGLALLKKCKEDLAKDERAAIKNLIQGIVNNL